MERGREDYFNGQPWLSKAKNTFDQVILVKHAIVASGKNEDLFIKKYLDDVYGESAHIPASASNMHNFIEGLRNSFPTKMRLFRAVDFSQVVAGILGCFIILRGIIIGRLFNAVLPGEAAMKTNQDSAVLSCHGMMNR